MESDPGRAPNQQMRPPPPPCPRARPAFGRAIFPLGHFRPALAIGRSSSPLGRLLVCSPAGAPD